MANEFKSSVGVKVSKAEATTWIDKYDQVMRKDKAADTKSLFYGRDALLKMLSEDGTSGITFFLALKPDDTGKEVVQLVLVPTKEDGILIWNDDNTAYDFGTPCPPYCPK